MRKQIPGCTVETACSNQGGGEGVMEPSVPTICGAGHSL